MKNFRKVLALILVVATLFSFTAMASAVEYKDADKITDDYTVAVDVLSAIGILNGYTDQTYRPTQNITRAEMAKMVAVLANAGDDVADLYSGANSFADVKGNWAISYIAYCNQTGIVQGRSATTFDPDANVTGIETAKMLLCVLGFDAEEQGYVGSNWKTNILRDAKNFGLLNDFADGYDVSKAISREEAAQMFLNALKANLVVGTISNNIVKVSNALYKDNVTWNLTLKDAEKFGEIWTLVYGNVVISNTPLASIYKGLTLTATRDCYGRPGHVWTYDNSKGVTVFSTFYANPVDLTYTKAATLANDLEDEITSTLYTYNLYVDGWRYATNAGQALTKNAMNIISASNTGKGVRTEVYVDDANRTVDIVIINTYIGEVVSVDKKNNKFTLSNGTTFSNKGYGFDEGDMILYWICNGHGAVDETKSSLNRTLHDAKLAEPVTAQVTRVTTNEQRLAKSTVTADGKPYEYAFNFGVTTRYSISQIDKDVVAVLGIDDIGTTYDLYLDEYGNIMEYAKHVTAADIRYAYGIENSNEEVYVKTVNGTPKYTYTADLVDFDGKINEDVVTDKGIYTELYNRYREDNSKFEKGALIKYQVKNDVAYAVDVATRVAGQLNVGTGEITDVNGNTIAWGNNNTKYLIRTWDYANGDYKYTAITGKNNLDASYVGQVFEGYAKGTLQYFATSDGIATYVFVDAVFAADYNRAYILNYVESVGDIAFVDLIGAYNAYSAVVNGEKAYIFDTANTTGQWSKLSRGLYESELSVIGLTDNGTPVYASTTKLESVGTAVQYTYNAGVITVKKIGQSDVFARYDADEVMIVVIHADGTFTTLEDANDLNDYSNRYGWKVVSSWLIEGSYNQVAELYIEVE